MAHFIRDNTELAAAKSTYRTNPNVPATQKVTAGDWNELRQALLDTQSFLQPLVHVESGRFLGRNTSNSGEVEALTGAEATALLDEFTGGAKGLVPASNGNSAQMLDAAGSWRTPVDVVDLRVGDYAVVPNTTNPLLTAQNTLNINAAIAAYNGTNKTLVLPAGTIYFDQANPGESPANRAWSIRFGPGVSRLALVGQGSNVTKIVQAGEGNFGQWDAIVVDGASRITLAGFSVEQGVINQPKVGDQMALIGVYATTGVDTEDVTIYDVFFGPCIGDALRVLGQDGGSIVKRLRLVNFTMRTGGHPYGAGGLGLGSRSGVSFQRGCRDVEIGNGFIHGAKNSPFEMEPTGTGIVDNIVLHDLVIDNEGGQTYLALAIAGSATSPLKRVRLSNVIVLQGGMTLAHSYDVGINGLTVYSSGLGPMAGNSQALVQFLNTNEDTTLKGLKVIRDTGSTAGPLLTVNHGVGAGNTTKRLLVSGEMYSAVGPGAGAAYIEINGADAPKIDGLKMRLGATAAGQYAIKFRSNTESTARPTVNDVDIFGSGTKIAAAVWFAATNSLSITDISVTNVRAKDVATTGVLFDVIGGTGIDAAPILQGCDFTGSTNEWLAQNSAAGLVFPIVAGNKGTTARRWQVGTVAPEGVVTAPQGSRYTRQNGDSTAEFFKQTGTGNTGWVQVTIP